MRCAEMDLASICMEKSDDEKAAEALQAECLSANARAALYQNNLHIIGEVVTELNSQLDTAKVAMEAKEKELEDQKAQYAKLYEVSTGMVKKVMLKVRAKLFRVH